MYCTVWREKFFNFAIRKNVLMGTVCMFCNAIMACTLDQNIEISLLLSGLVFPALRGRRDFSLDVLMSNLVI